MNAKPTPANNTKQEQTAPLTWEAIGKLSKAEYLARRDEIQQWMKKHVVSGRVIP